MDKPSRQHFGVILKNHSGLGLTSQFYISLLNRSRDGVHIQASSQLPIIFDTKFSYYRSFYLSTNASTLTMNLLEGLGLLSILINEAAIELARMTILQPQQTLLGIW